MSWWWRVRGERRIWRVDVSDMRSEVGWGEVRWEMDLSLTVSLLTVLSLTSPSQAETSVLSGPGLQPQTSVLPCRYFFINTTDLRDNRLAVTITGKNEAGLCKPRLEWRRVVDSELVMVRYKLYQTCHDIQINVTASLKHLSGSPVNTQVSPVILTYVRLWEVSLNRALLILTPVTAPPLVWSSGQKTTSVLLHLNKWSGTSPGSASASTWRRLWRRLGGCWVTGGLSVGVTTWWRPGRSTGPAMVSTPASRCSGTASSPGSPGGPSYPTLSSLLTWETGLW